MKWNYFRILAVLAGGVMLVTLLGGYALACSYVYLLPSLPSIASMRNVELQVPLRVYTRSGALIAQIGEQRRIPVSYDQIPDLVKHAFLAAEDERFFAHGGIDYFGVVRAVLVDVVSGDKTQGASTITMQAARNMFLTLDKTARRKLQETFVTYRMEHEFTKQEIFGLYMNVIFFGQRAYGVAAAAEAFFGKTLDKLDVAEAATIAGVPKAPSRYNPIVDPELATSRRSYVLRRMRELGYIDAATAEAANKEPMQARAHAPLYDVEAPYVAEMARLELRQRFGPSAESAGYKVYTTIDGRLQADANRAVRVGLIEYDRRHGWRGPAGHVDLPAHGEPDYDDLVDEYSGIGNLQPAIVVSVLDRSVHAYVKSLGPVQIDWDGLSWARKELRNDALGPAPKDAGQVLARGDVVYVVADDKGHAQLGQIPEAQSALVALDPNDGSIVALVGGFDYFTNKYNRVTQARRLPGSGFKPFLYSAALEHGFTPASVILDAPIVLDGNGEDTWRPENSTREFGGPTRLREALVRSRNLVSIRILKELGISTAIDYITRFGFDRARPAPRPDARARHHGGHAARSRRRLRGVRQRWLQGAALLHRAHRGRRRAGSVAGEAAHGLQPVRCPGDAGRRRDAGRTGARLRHEPRRARAAAARAGRAAGHQRAERLPHGRHDGGRHQARHRAARAGPRQERHRRQDRHDQRGEGHLVQRLHAQPGRDRVGGLRSGAPARRGRGGRAHRAADLDRVHERGAQGRHRAAPDDARGHRDLAHLARERHARERRESQRRAGDVPDRTPALERGCAGAGTADPDERRADLLTAR